MRINTGWWGCLSIVPPAADGGNTSPHRPPEFSAEGPQNGQRSRDLVQGDPSSPLTLAHKLLEGLRTVQEELGKVHFIAGTAIQ
jgi:hypothetical protein